MARPACGTQAMACGVNLPNENQDEVKQLKIFVHDYMMRGREREREITDRVTRMSRCL